MLWYKLSNISQGNRSQPRKNIRPAPKIKSLPRHAWASQPFVWDLPRAIHPWHLPAAPRTGWPAAMLAPGRSGELLVRKAGGFNHLLLDGDFRSGCWPGASSVMLVRAPTRGREVCAFPGTEVGLQGWNFCPTPVCALEVGEGTQGKGWTTSYSGGCGPTYPFLSSTMGVKLPPARFPPLLWRQVFLTQISSLNQFRQLSHKYHRLPRKVVESPSLGIFKSCLDMSWTTGSRRPCLSRR